MYFKIRYINIKIILKVIKIINTYSNQLSLEIVERQTCNSSSVPL